MSAQQRSDLDALLRGLPLDLGGDVAVQRPLMEQLMTSHPLPDDVTVESIVVGGVPASVIDVDGVDTSRVMLYLHGGGYALGSATAAAGLASEIGRRAGVRVVSVDYRLAPEHRFPAAVDDAVAVYRGLLEVMPAAKVVIAGESAGAGLAVATLLAARDSALPLPQASGSALAVGRSVPGRCSRERRRRPRPVPTVAALQRRAADCL